MHYPRLVKSLSSKQPEHPPFENEFSKRWRHFTFWVSQHQPIARMLSLTVALVLFLVFLPPIIRIIFWNGIQAHKILASMLFIFGLLAISLVWSAGQIVDTKAFLFFNLRGLRPVWLDRVMLGVTQIGSGVAALGIALLLFWTEGRLLAYEFILGTLTLWLVVELVKILIFRSRPFIHLNQTRIVGYRAIGHSFPSGHTSQVFFTATLVALHFEPSVWVLIVLYFTASMVGITRMYIGAHYPRDVLAGAILGSVWGSLALIIDGYVLGGFK
jgi:membrane-associated phospholipid phosphatase